MKMINITVEPQEEGYLLTIQKEDTTTIYNQGNCGQRCNVTIAVTSRAEAIERIRQELESE